MFISYQSQQRVISQVRALLDFSSGKVAYPVQKVCSRMMKEAFWFPKFNYSPLKELILTHNCYAPIVLLIVIRVAHIVSHKGTSLKWLMSNNKQANLWYWVEYFLSPIFYTETKHVHDNTSSQLRSETTAWSS